MESYAPDLIFKQIYGNWLTFYLVWNYTIYISIILIAIFNWFYRMITYKIPFNKLCSSNLSSALLVQVILICIAKIIFLVDPFNFEKIYSDVCISFLKNLISYLIFSAYIILILFWRNLTTKTQQRSYFKKVLLPLIILDSCIFLIALPVTMIYAAIFPQSPNLFINTLGSSIALGLMGIISVYYGIKIYKRILELKKDSINYKFTRKALLKIFIWSLTAIFASIILVILVIVNYSIAYKLNYYQAGWGYYIYNSIFDFTEALLTIMLFANITLFKTVKEDKGVRRVDTSNSELIAA
jgi:hypothetical protein